MTLKKHLILSFLIALLLFSINLPFVSANPGKGVGITSGAGTVMVYSSDGNTLKEVNLEIYNKKGESVLNQTIYGTWGFKRFEIGTYTFIFSKEGYNTITKEVKIKPRKFTILEIVMKSS